MQNAIERKNRGNGATTPPRCSGRKAGLDSGDWKYRHKEDRTLFVDLCQGMQKQICPLFFYAWEAPPPLTGPECWPNSHQRIDNPLKLQDILTGGHDTKGEAKGLGWNKKPLASP